MMAMSRTVKGPATEDEQWDWSESIWTRLENRRVGSFNLGVDKDCLLLNKLILEKRPKVDLKRIGATTIYRVDTLEHVLSAIHRKRLWLSSPFLWEDPWEDSIRRHIDSAAQPEGMSFDCFALCFSKQPSCEAIWRRMKDKGRLVCIKTTVKNLLSSIKIPSEDDIAEIDEQVFFGFVDYLSPAKAKQFQRESNSFLEQNDRNGKADIARVASLFAKRKPFEFEKEFRFVFRPKRQPGQPVRNYYELDLSPETLIQSLQADPWCGDYEYEMISGYFKCLGFGCSRSDLAKPMI